MLFCRRCGQSPHIDEESFKEIRNTYGYEVAWIDPHNGDTVDYGDCETTDSDHESYECPYCGSSDIEFDSEAQIDEAELLRRRYDEEQAIARRQREEEMKKMEYERKAKDPSRQWDVEVNV